MPAGTAPPVRLRSRPYFTSGNRIVSRMPRPVIAMSRRSIPMPMPPDGGMACSSARRKEVLVDAHRLGVTTGGELRLLDEALALHDGVDELGVRRRELEAADVEVPLLDHAGAGAVLAG